MARIRQQAVAVWESEQQAIVLIQTNTVHCKFLCLQPLPTRSLPRKVIPISPKHPRTGNIGGEPRLVHDVKLCVDPLTQP